MVYVKYLDSYIAGEESDCYTYDEDSPEDV